MHFHRHLHRRARRRGSWSSRCERRDDEGWRRRPRRRRVVRRQHGSQRAQGARREGLDVQDGVPRVYGHECGRQREFFPFLWRCVGTKANVVRFDSPPRPTYAPTTRTARRREPTTSIRSRSRKSTTSRAWSMRTTSTRVSSAVSPRPSTVRSTRFAVEGAVLMPLRRARDRQEGNPTPAHGRSPQEDSRRHASQGRPQRLYRRRPEYEQVAVPQVRRLCSRFPSRAKR